MTMEEEHPYEEYEKTVKALGTQFCKVWECRFMGIIKYNGYCEEHKNKRFASDELNEGGKNGNI